MAERKPQKLPTVVWARDWPALIAAGRTPRDRALLTLLPYTGLRITSALLLQWTDILWDRELVHVRPETAKRKKEHYVPLAPVARAALEQYHAELGRPAAGPLFPGRQDALGRQDGRLSRAQAWRIVQAAGEAVGVSIGPHSLRHSCGTRLAEIEEPLEVIRAFLNHSKLDMAARYVQVAAPRLKRAAEGM